MVVDSNHKDKEAIRDQTEVDLEEETIKVILEVETDRVISEVVTDLKEASENDKNQSRILFIILVAILVKFSQFAPWIL